MCGETRIPRDVWGGKHASRGNTHPYDTGHISFPGGQVILIAPGGHIILERTVYPVR